MGNAVVIKGGIARRINPKTGGDQGQLGIPGAVSAASDGEFIVVVYKTGSARRYRADTGGDQGLLEIGRAHV